jgi:cytochrome c-type biogenesis protein CcmH
MRAFAVVVLFVALVAPALAVTPEEILKDSVLESRARNLSRELRCMVCQNQSIDDSEAPLAKDLRVLVRERLTQGDSDKCCCGRRCNGTRCCSGACRRPCCSAA